MKPAAVASCLIAALALATPVGAAGSAEDVARAKSYFDAASQAYAAAQYLAAADAFLKAYALLPSPSLTFSAAQAYRRQYLIDGSPEHLREALRLYRDYLSRAEQGRRRQEAADALSELGAFELRLGAAEAAPQRERPTQILVTSRTPGAQTSIDGGPPREVPLVARVTAGEHTVVVRGSGYFEESAKVIAVPRETFTLNVLLRPKPVVLQVRGDEGSRVYLDGQLIARLPSPGPLMFQGGEHALSVTRAGHVPYSTALSLQSGSRVELDVALPPTTKRYAAYAVLGLGGVGIVATGVFAGLAVSERVKAQDIYDAKQKGEITSAQGQAFNDALENRDARLINAAVAGGFAAALTITGVGLYLFDDPDVSAAGGGRPARDAPPPHAPGPELFIDGSGVSLRGYF